MAKAKSLVGLDVHAAKIVAAVSERPVTGAADQDCFGLPEAVVHGPGLQERHEQAFGGDELAPHHRRPGARAATRSEKVHDTNDAGVGVGSGPSVAAAR